MAVVLVTPDAFSERFDAHASGLGKSTRRPPAPEMKLRDLPPIQPKKNRFAQLFVEKADGTRILLAGGSQHSEEAKETTSWTNFSLQSVKEMRKEKVQVIQTFGEDYAFFFGETPRVMSFSGTLLNSKSHSWRAEFWSNYEKHFRGTRLVREKARLYMIYDDILLQGYMLAAQATDNANLPHQIPFGFSMLITSYANMQSMQDPTNALFRKESGSVRDLGDLPGFDQLGNELTAVTLSPQAQALLAPTQLAVIKLGEDRSDAQALFDLLTSDRAKTLLQAGMQGGPKALLGTGASMGFGAATNAVPALRHIEPLFTQGAQAVANGSLQDAAQGKRFFDPTQNRVAAGAYMASAVGMGSFLVSSAGFAQPGDIRNSSGAPIKSKSTGRPLGATGVQAGAGSAPGRVATAKDINRSPDGDE